MDTKFVQLIAVKILKTCHLKATMCRFASLEEPAHHFLAALEASSFRIQDHAPMIIAGVSALNTEAAQQTKTRVPSCHGSGITG